MSLYRIEKEFFKNVTQHQKEKMLEDFELDNNGDILIPYTHKGYTVNNLHIKFRKDVKAISMFSGAGGLDIGTQLAGIKVISSLDIFEDSVETLKKNKFFAGDVRADIEIVPQDIHLVRNQEEGIHCGDNGIFKGMPLTEEQKALSQIARDIYRVYPFDGKYILDQARLIICQSNAKKVHLNLPYGRNQSPG